MRVTQRQGLFAGVAIVSFAAVMLQVALTRLYSALFGNHFAFLAISLSLFGIGMGGVLLYVLPSLVAPPRLFARLAYLSGVCSVATAASTTFVVRSKPITELDTGTLANLVVLYAISATPFVLVGAVIAAALRHAAVDVSKLYLADLAGAAAGGLGAIAALRLGAPRAALIVAVLMALAGLAFAIGGRAPVRSYEAGSRPSFSVVAVFIAGAAALLAGDLGAPWLKLPTLRHTSRVEFERWNEMALITVDKPERGTAWMRMDGSAATAILDPKTTPPLHPDEMAYVLHKDKGPVLVIGAGGGRDVRAALKAGQTEIYAVEINPIIVNDVMRGKYREFSGALYDRPEVHVEIADGRSYVRRSPIKFRNIVLSLVDTWAAASAGALALSENSLYTVEAFQDFIEHLEPEGTLLVNRWDPEFERLLALAVAALRGLGVENPREHLYGCGHQRSTSLLIKRTPLDPKEIRALHANCKQNKFTPAFLPGKAYSDLRERLVSMDVEAAAPDHPTDLTPPTDDRPFFFYTVPARRFFSALADHDKLADQNQGLLTLVGLLAASFVVAALAILGPLAWAGRAALRSSGGGLARGTPAALLFFWCIGVGFVAVELSLLQHLVLFLGHPVYALSTVLVVLLLATGVGSLLTDRIDVAQAARHAGRRAEILVVLLAVYAVGLGPLLGAVVGLPFALRLLLTFVLIAPLGILMGAQAPLAIRIVGARGPNLIPWCWGLNGLASVVATAAGTLLALHAGFSALLLAGAASYLIAIAATPRA